MSIYTYVYQPMADLHYIYTTVVFCYSPILVCYIIIIIIAYPHYASHSIIVTYYMVHTLSSHLHPAISILFSFPSIHLLI